MRYIKAFSLHTKTWCKLPIATWSETSAYTSMLLCPSACKASASVCEPGAKHTIQAPKGWWNSWTYHVPLCVYAGNSLLRPNPTTTSPLPSPYKKKTSLLTICKTKSACATSPDEGATPGKIAPPEESYPGQYKFLPPASNPLTFHHVHRLMREDHYGRAPAIPKVRFYLRSWRR